MDEAKIRELIQMGREFMKMPPDDDFVSDQQRRLPQPPLAKAAMGGKKTALPRTFGDLEHEDDLLRVLAARASHRVYTGEELTLLQLSFLLWAQQGVKGIRGNNYATLRTVACGGARHEFECYMAVRLVDGLAPGLYHYLPLEHAVEYMGPIPGDEEETLTQSLCGQRWGAKAAVVFYYSMAAYRAEWRYGIHAHRVALIDAGHITQNLYIAATALGLGACAIAAVETPFVNAMLSLDGEEEFVFYAATVGGISDADKRAELDFYAFLREEM